MFKKIILTISLLTFPLFLVTSPVHAIDGFITITNPNGGTFTEGDTMNITWTSSSNIDQVNIGYKSCDSCLDWVVFTTPNTGSYSWKVDVGNTTKTDFWLSITGYETGQGSVSSTSGHFTVNQNPPLNTGSSSSNTTASPASNYPYPAGYKPTATPTPTLAPTPTPKPLPPLVTIYTLVLYQEFTFEGSLTTNLKDIKDPKNVENFTLDTQSGFTFIFEEALNLTDQKTLAALQNTKDYWEYETWFIWIEWEWWIKYDITETINVEYKNDALTSYAPEIITEPKPTPTPAKTKASPAPRKSPTVLGAEAGKVKIALNDGTPVKIAPRVTLDTPQSPASSPLYKLIGHTSHTNLTWTLSHNGIKSNISPTINPDSGEFTYSNNNLIKGANTFVLTYQAPDSTPVSLEPVVIMYDPSLWTKYGQTILIAIAFILVFVAGLFLPRLLPKLKKLLKLKKRK